MDIAAASLGLSAAALAVSIIAITRRERKQDGTSWKIPITHVESQATKIPIRTARRKKEEGFIVEPESEAQAARQAIIEKNSREGKNTPLTELDYEDT